MAVRFDIRELRGRDDQSLHDVCPNISLETETLPTGLAASYASLSSLPARDVGQARRSDRAARRVYGWLSTWVPPYLRGTFRSERQCWHHAEWREVEEDAVQHGLLAVLVRGTERWTCTTDDHALRWTKAVVRNFVISQCARPRARRAVLPLGLVAVPETDEVVNARDSLLRLISLVRVEVHALVRPRDRLSALDAYDELVAFSFRSLKCGKPVSAASSDRVRHRRLRARRLVHRVIDDLISRNIAYEARTDLLRFAWLMGVELRPGHGRKSNAGVTAPSDPAL
jgi:hypothetical protein